MIEYAHCQDHGPRPLFLLCSHVLQGHDICRDPEIPELLACAPCLSNLLHIAKGHPEEMETTTLELTVMCDLCCTQRSFLPAPKIVSVQL